MLTPSGQPDRCSDLRTLSCNGCSIRSGRVRSKPRASALVWNATIDLSNEYCRWLSTM
jgi:hypothetical protein